MFRKECAFSAPHVAPITILSKYVAVGEQPLQHMRHRSVKFVNKVCMTTNNTVNNTPASITLEPEKLHISNKLEHTVSNVKQNTISRGLNVITLVLESCVELTILIKLHTNVKIISPLLSIKT